MGWWVNDSKKMSVKYVEASSIFCNGRADTRSQ